MKFEAYHCTAFYRIGNSYTIKARLILSREVILSRLSAGSAWTNLHEELHAKANAVNIADTKVSGKVETKFFR